MTLPSKLPPAPPPSKRAAPAPIATAKAPGLTVPTKPSGRGLAMVVYAVEAWGKTTLGAYAPNSVLLLAPRETGYITLYDNDRAPARPMGVMDSWTTLLAQVRATPLDCEWLVLDAMTGLERLCHEHVCQHTYGGNWGKGKDGFHCYQQGPKVAITDWLQLLAALDAVRESGTNVMILGHAKQEEYKNPLGENYHRVVVDCNAHTWGVTFKWAATVLYGAYYSDVKDKTDRGGTMRVMHTQRSNAVDAKNLLGLPDILDMPNDHTEAWDKLSGYLYPRKGQA